MKVKVDRERCQGHARCAALAPELFALDDSAMRARPAMEPCRPRSPTRRIWRKRTARNSRSRSTTMSTPSAGERLGHRLRSPRSALDRGPVSDLGDAARNNARSRTRNAIAASISRRATRTCARSPTTPSTSPRAASWCARPRRRACPAPPITIRSAAPSGRRRSCCCRPSRRTPSSDTSRARATSAAR